MSYTVIVSFKLKAEFAVEFMQYMQEQAKNSLINEPGCIIFEIWNHPNVPEQVYLYEAYVNRGAFKYHLESEHFKEFDAAVDHMILDKKVITANI